MERCAQCGQPATTFAYSGNPPKVTAAYCYVHSSLAGLGEPLPAWVQALGQELSLSPNAVFFLWSAFRGRGSLCRNAMGCCIAVWQEAEARFGPSAGEALRALGVTSGREIGRVLHALLAAGVERLAEDERLEDFAGLESVGEIP